jgi:hypothetical protein
MQSSQRRNSDPLAARNQDAAVSAATTAFDAVDRPPPLRRHVSAPEPRTRSPPLHSLNPARPLPLDQQDGVPSLIRQQSAPNPRTDTIPDAGAMLVSLFPPSQAVSELLEPKQTDETEESPSSMNIQEAAAAVASPVIVHIQEENNGVSWLLVLSMDEIQIIAKFLTIPELCGMTKTCARLREAMSTDLIWRPKVVKALKTGDYAHLTQIYPELAKDAERMTLKIAYNKYKTPPLVPSDRFAWDDVVVSTFTVLNYADIVTDLIVMTTYREEDHRNDLFGISLAFVLLTPVLLVCMEHHKLTRMTPTILFLTLSQLRCFYEAIHYFRQRYRRYRLTGQVAAKAGSELYQTKDEAERRSTNVSLLKVFEAVFESLPQALLQSYVLIALSRIYLASIISVMCSVISAALGLTSLCRLDSYQYKTSKERVAVLSIVFVFVLCGLAFRFCGYSMLFVAIGSQGYIALVVSFGLNLLVDCLLQTVQVEYYCYMPFMAFMTTLTPLTFYPNWGNFKRFNAALFIVNVAVPLGCTAASLISKPEQEYWTGKLIFQIVCGVLHTLSFCPLVHTEVQIFIR